MRRGGRRSGAAVRKCGWGAAEGGGRGGRLAATAPVFWAIIVVLLLLGFGARLGGLERLLLLLAAAAGGRAWRRGRAAAALPVGARRREERLEIGVGQRRRAGPCVVGIRHGRCCHVGLAVVLASAAAVSCGLFYTDAGARLCLAAAPAAALCHCTPAQSIFKGAALPLPCGGLSSRETCMQGATHRPVTRSFVRKCTSGN
jgi:hypothetical protein